MTCPRDLLRTEKRLTPRRATVQIVVQGREECLCRLTFHFPQCANHALGAECEKHRRKPEQVVAPIESTEGRFTRAERDEFEASKVMPDEFMSEDASVMSAIGREVDHMEGGTRDVGCD